MVAGMLLALKPGICRIGWMGVSATCRRRGIGTALLEHAASLVERPGGLRVTTFGPDNPMGGITRDFYRKHGFQPREIKPGGPNGYSKQQFYKKLRQ
jgi:ribosomal protein S18 acetylase RimI-like enzyme